MEIGHLGEVFYTEAADFVFVGAAANDTGSATSCSFLRAHYEENVNNLRGGRPLSIHVVYDFDLAKVHYCMYNPP